MLKYCFNMVLDSPYLSNEGRFIRLVQQYSVPGFYNPTKEKIMSSGLGTYEALNYYLSKILNNIYFYGFNLFYS